MNYKGIDFKVKFEVEVKSVSTRRIEHFKKIEEIDKKENYNKSSTLQKVLQNIAGVENEDDECLTETDSENEDENISKQKTK